MNFENHINTIVLNEESAPKRKYKPTGTVGRWLKKTSLLSGLVGLAYAGGIGEVDAAKPEGEYKPKQELHDENIVEDLHEDASFKWSVEYVPKNVDGRNILAERFIKIDKASNEISVIGEYDNVVDAANAISTMDDVPTEVKSFAHYPVLALETEAKFIDAGFVKPETANTGETHTETRVFDGYGIHAENIVEVDGEGNTTALLDSDNEYFYKQKPFQGYK